MLVDKSRGRRLNAAFTLDTVVFYEYNPNKKYDFCYLTNNFARKLKNNVFFRGSCLSCFSLNSIMEASGSLRRDLSYDTYLIVGWYNALSFYLITP